MLPLQGYKYAARTTFVFGLPRSGTTWLARILDSHPDVLYRHEPALSLPNNALALDCDWIEQAGEYIGETSTWLNRLARVRNPRAVADRPIFRKSYHTNMQHVLRSMLVHAAKGLGWLPSMERPIEALRIPDFVDLDKTRQLKLVIKSINPKRNLPLFLAAAPAASFVFILRHPCAQIASVVRGVRKDRLRHRSVSAKDATNEEARLALVRGLATEWVSTNQRILEHIGKRKNCYVLRHEDLTGSPESEAKRLFSFCGLDWRDETDAFCKQSARRPRVYSYYGVRRDPESAVNGWRSELSPSEIEEIKAIILGSTPGKMYLPNFSSSRQRPSKQCEEPQSVASFG